MTAAELKRVTQMEDAMSREYGEQLVLQQTTRDVDISDTHVVRKIGREFSIKSETSNL